MLAVWLVLRLVAQLEPEELALIAPRLGVLALFARQKTAGTLDAPWTAMNALKIISASAWLWAASLSAGCGANGAGDQEPVSNDELAVSLGGTSHWDPVNCNASRIQCNGMHCCGTGEAMTGAYLDANDFQCRPVTGATESSCGVFTTTRTIEGVTLRACPSGFYMKGLHVGNNTITCCNYPAFNPSRSFQLDGHGEAPTQGTAPRIKSPSPFAGVCSDTSAHVCPAGSVMEGIHVDGNYFLCGT